MMIRSRIPYLGKNPVNTQNLTLTSKTSEINKVNMSIYSVYIVYIYKIYILYIVYNTYYIQYIQYIIHTIPILKLLYVYITFTIFMYLHRSLLQQWFEHSGVSSSSFDLNFADKLSKSEAAAIFRLTLYTIYVYIHTYMNYCTATTFKGSQLTVGALENN